MKPFTLYQQHDAMDCGPTCLRMVAKYHGAAHSAQYLRNLAEIGKDGVNMLGIAQAAEAIGFRTLAVKVPLHKLLEDAPLPCIVHWAQNHFVVVASPPRPRWGSFFSPLRGLGAIWGGKKSSHDFSNKIPNEATNKAPFGGLGAGLGLGLLIADPAKGFISYTYEEFESAWASTVEDGQRLGIALLLEPSPQFRAITEQIENDEQTTTNSTLGFGSLFGYLWRFRGLLVQLGLGLLVGSVLQLVLPFLTQSVVDTGIQTRNLHFIYIVLAAQLMLFVGRMSVDFIRAWILMHISMRINLGILSDFLAKLLRLPIAFFDSKLTGDIMQRIGDHSRIESFLTGTSLSTLFSLFNLLIYSFVLMAYNVAIFGVFMLFSALYVVWVMFFLKYRRQLDHKRFALSSQNQSSLIQLITGVQEIKLNNAEHLKRWAWENLQIKQFKLSMKGLAVGQYQQAGASFLNESKNIIITFMAATAVVQGQLTLGAMMALQYIVGQMNSPVEQFIQFVQHWQDAKISLERLNEIHAIEDESASPQTPEGGFNTVFKAPFGGLGAGILIQNLTFTYPGAGNEPVLKNINLSIPKGKVTAIVGTSGSGKTTLLKLLLRFYAPQQGRITTTGSLRQWRNQCGTVMQDGFIFSDSIANNIAVGDETPNWKKLCNALRVANIEDFVSSLPLGVNTKIGMEGNGISGGQKQRILIARAVYKNPDYLFFDEATSALDSNNERVIMENLAAFFYGRTVVVVAHRLSTVKNADQIIVLDAGEVAEVGTHQSLTLKRGKYYELVKNQLELAA
jgi:ATP-binding cassette, subfamily B, bacterial